MIVYGYAKDYMYTGDGTLLVRVRVPAIHGPYVQTNKQGKYIKSYTLDQDLPYYQSVLLPHLPNDGEVVMLSSTNDKKSDFVVIGLTGGSYYNGATDIGG